MNRSRIRDFQEGVSPVIATILMVALTVVLASVVYMWTMGFMDGSVNTPRGIMTIKGSPSSYFIATVNSMDGTLSVDEADYYLVNTNGVTVESGQVRDIYNKDGNVRFNDVDSDYKVSPDDDFRLKGNNNGGTCGSGYKFTIKFAENSEVVMTDRTP